MGTIILGVVGYCLGQWLGVVMLLVVVAGLVCLSIAHSIFPQLPWGNLNVIDWVVFLGAAIAGYLVKKTKDAAKKAETEKKAAEAAEERERVAKEKAAAEAKEKAEAQAAKEKAERLERLHDAGPRIRGKVK